MSRLRFALTLLVAVTPVTSATPEFGIQAVRIDPPPIIDGKLDEEVWNTAASISGFMQVRPAPPQIDPVFEVVFCFLTVPRSLIHPAGPDFRSLASAPLVP